MPSGAEQQQGHAGPRVTVRSVGFEAITLRICSLTLSAGRAAAGF